MCTDHAERGSAGDARFGAGGDRADAAWSGVFIGPRTILRAERLDEVRPLVTAADAAARGGAWVVMLLAYEAAPAFDAALIVHAGGTAPLAWAAVYDSPLHDSSSKAQPHPGPHDSAVLEPWTPLIDEAAYAQRVDALLDNIAAGDTYQVNLTFPLSSSVRGIALEQWYARLQRQAQVPYAAFIDLGDQVVISLSPELFFERTGSRVLTRPMKGTHARGRWPDDDVAARQALASSEKARAENVMIVDLLRNDLGRIATTGSVHVSALHTIEPYPTVWQMTSTIEAEVAADRPLWDVLEALFPCGSVTGAPKTRTMSLIAAHEVQPRGIYTGAIGLLRPGGDVVMSVPIRTITIDKASGQATLGVGAGLTSDSRPDEEYAECLLKAQFLGDIPALAIPGLFETLRLESGRYWLRERHVARIVASATFLGMPCPHPEIEQALDRVANEHPAGCWRVRLTLTRDGEVTCTAEPHDPVSAGTWHVAFAARAIDARDRRLFHKTLDRSVYALARDQRPGMDDVLLWNGAGELTESTVANLVVELDGQRWTPPVSSGLLPGTFRAELLERGQVRERVLTRHDVCRASRVWLINSLRGWIEVRVERPETTDGEA